MEETKCGVNTMFLQTELTDHDVCLLFSLNFFVLCEEEQLLFSFFRAVGVVPLPEGSLLIISCYQIGSGTLCKIVLFLCIPINASIRYIVDL